MCIYHGQTEAHYKEVLGGNFEPPKTRLQSIGDRLPLDVEIDDAENVVELELEDGLDIDAMLAKDLSEIMTELED
jgi:hypothetical protein